MRKGLTALFIGLIILVFIPPILGIVAKKSLENTILELPLPAGVTMSLKDYTFGWLSSYVALDIQIEKTPARAHYISDQTLDVIVHGNIQHGPFLFAKNHFKIGVAQINTFTTLEDIHGLDPSVQEELKLLFKEKHLVNINSWVKFNQDIHIDLNSSPIQAASAGDVLQWSGLQAHIQVNQKFDRFDADVKVSPLLFSTAQGALLDMAQVQFTAALTRGENSPWVGDQMLTLPTFYLKDETGSVLRFDHLRLVSMSSIMNQLLQASVTLEANNMNVANEQVDQLRFEIQLDNLASEPLLELSEFINQSQGTLSLRDKQHLLRVATQVLARGADARVNYRVNIRDEEIHLNADLDFPDIQDEITDSLLVNAQLLFAQLHADVELNVPQDLASSTLLFALNQNLPLLLQQGMIVVDGNVYHLAFSYQTGKFLLNGKEISQNELLALLTLLLANPNESTVH